jgi:peptidoglycan-associated lipoprotein
MYISTIKNGSYSAPERYTFPDLSDKSNFSKFNESSVSISLDGRSLFLYKRGDIYMISTDQTAKKPKKLEKQVNLSHYQNHASVSKDNNTIYFSSETKNGFGGTDLFKCVRNDKGEWSEAQLLDSTVNTMFNEDAPFISEEGILYFSSNGHPGFGDYDVYKTEFKNGKWSKPENLGQPINSTGPDIFLSMINKNEGYYSSYRPGGSGDLDIYEVNFDVPLKKDTIPDPLLAKEKPVETPEPGNTGKYLTEKELQELGWITSDLYFNYNQSGLRDDAIATLDHNIEILKKNKKLNITISGFSDARGQEKYNTQLSLNRAQTVKQYILKKGLGRDRIKSVEGLGETSLLNDCGDGTECEEAEHQRNRRVQVQVLNENYKQKNVVFTGTE